MGVLVVLMAQILAADLGGRLATRYAETRLEDPAVARIVFEREEDRNRLDRRKTPAPLVPEPTIRELEARLGAAQGSPVRLYGRRQPSQSQFRLPGAAAPCDDWLPPIATVVLDAADPLLLQTRLTRTLPREAGPTEDATLAPDIATALPAIADRDRAVALAHPRIVATLRDLCGLPADRPLRLDWAIGTGGTLPGQALQVEILGAVAEPPPLHPYVTEMIFFEHDYAYAQTIQGQTAVEPFDTAAAYFPIDGFDTVAAILAAEGYTLRDDSAAAVQELQRIGRLARVVPPVVIAINLAACVIVVFLMLDAILELNKRVLALFLAHGFRRADMLATLGLHLTPALGLAGLVVSGLAAGLWPVLRAAEILPQDIGPLEPLRDRAVLATLGYAAAAVAGATLAVALIWWSRTRDRLKTYLQE